MPSRSLPLPPPPPEIHHSHRSSAAILPSVLAGALSLLLLVSLSVLCRKLSRKRTAPADPKAPHEFPYSVLRRATASFSSSNRLGQGGFGPVFKGTLSSGQIVAVKVMDCSGSIQGGHEFQNELMFASRIDTNDHVVSILGFSSSDEPSARRRKRRKRLLLVYEYMPNGSLQDGLLDRKCPELMNWKRRYAIAVDIAKGIEYLHYSCNPPIVHGDIKPSNVLLDSDFNAKIADFGLARSVNEDDINEAVIGCDEEVANGGTKRGVRVGDDNGSILEETESVMTEEVIVNVDLSPEVAFSPETVGIEASPSEVLDKDGEIESCFDRASTDSNRKGIARKKSGLGRDWWWKQDNGGFGPESTRIKDYVMEWIGSEIKKEKPKCELIANATPSSLEEGNMVKLEHKKHKKTRKPREWWKEEFCEELTKKSKKKRGLKSGAGGELWWQRDEDFTPERKKRKSRNSRGSIDWWLDGFSGEFRSGRRNSQDWPSGEIPKSGGISSTPSMRGTVCYIAPECGGGDQFSEKCDVYSFGVLLLVLVSGRRPLQVTASPMSEFERANLISWARQLGRNGKLLELVDPSVQSLDGEQAMRCLTIALLCLQRVPCKRPTMREIVGMLSGHTEPPHLPFEFSPSPPSKFPSKSQKKARRVH